MVSTRTDRIMLGVFVVGLLTATAACALHPQNGRTPATKPSPTAGEPSPAKTVPVSLPAAPEPKVQPQERPPSPEVPAIGARPSNDADDPRAVIDWLLNRAK